MENCIFCKIINQEIPSYKIYEDDKVYAFLDISQATKGHNLVVPKNMLRIFSTMMRTWQQTSSHVFLKLHVRLNMLFPKWTD